MKCGEDMVVALNIDFDKIAHWVEAVENAEHTPEEKDAPIMNVEANFIVPEDERYKDLAFPRLTQLQATTEIGEKHGSLISLADVPEGMRGQRPYRRPDYAEEWNSAKKHSWTAVPPVDVETVSLIVAVGGERPSTFWWCMPRKKTWSMGFCGLESGDAYGDPD